MTQPDLAYFDTGEGRRIAYRSRSGSSPTLVFLPGYASDMDGTKAIALDVFADARGLGLLRFDYSGTGASDGDFAEGTLARWLDEALALIDALTDGPLILVGSSMGGWLMLHVALARPARIAALVGIAAAPDFTDWGYSPDDKAALLQAGRIVLTDPSGGDPQVTHRAFWESGESLRVLDAPIAIEAPVRLIHGEADRDVPIGIALKLLDRLRSADVQLHLIKGAGHRLSEPRDIEAILRAVDHLLERPS
ncbi:MAG TPA: alpha/beta hydrolase [Sphingomicrobium sp.]|nr:alpha/beta hydrolase [Sphingomicrobium sp.]